MRYDIVLRNLGNSKYGNAIEPKVFHPNHYLVRVPNMRINDLESNMRNTV